mmetsp:Transcript_49115/g.106817  ORF Transcript_49115/g.106817 Transcript_49115/m.106817 type:complete len:230 (+) Transcript_49115:318-1007(+)
MWRSNFALQVAAHVLALTVQGHPGAVKQLLQGEEDAALGIFCAPDGLGGFAMIRTNGALNGGAVAVLVLDNGPDAVSARVTSLDICPVKLRLVAMIHVNPPLLSALNKFLIPPAAGALPGVLYPVGSPQRSAFSLESRIAVLRDSLSDVVIPHVRRYEEHPGTLGVGLHLREMDATVGPVRQRRVVRVVPAVRPVAMRLVDRTCRPARRRIGPDFEGVHVGHHLLIVGL